MEGMIRRTSLHIATAVAMLGAVLAFAGTAQADSGMRIVGKPATKEQLAAAAVRCERGEFCGWCHAAYQGGLFHYDGDDTNLSSNIGKWNDTITGSYWTDCDGH